ncbi:MAG TPA: fumarylacetoacetate hydrolase family protein [Vineibacter sp.]|nr:fumarylacetoacetate hydrolase family protein [Vineibacter sp.]
MRLASFQVDEKPTWGVVEGDEVADVGALLREECTDLRAAIAAQAWSAIRRAGEKARRYPIDAITWRPVIPNPGKIICIGLNYESHRRETGRSEVGHPTVFLRLPDSQIGHRAPIIRPRVSEQLDYEGELAVIIGTGGRHIGESDALAHVAGYACYNEATVRDWQRHTHQFTPGKNFPGTGAFGPAMVTRDEIRDPEALHLTTRVNGIAVQDAGLDQLIFSIPRLIAYCSAFTRLEPGDVIATGTPGGVGFKREPPLFLKPGDTVDVEITGVGRLTNGVADEV